MTGSMSKWSTQLVFNTEFFVEQIKRIEKLDMAPFIFFCLQNYIT